MLAGRGEASDLWGGNGTASTVMAFPVGKCSNLWLGLSVIAQVKRSLTSVAILILGLGGILGEWAAAIVFASSTGEVGCSSSSSGGGGMSILM